MELKTQTEEAILKAKLRSIARQIEYHYDQVEILTQQYKNAESELKRL